MLQASVVDGGPTLKQHRLKTQCLVFAGLCKRRGLPNLQAEKPFLKMKKRHWTHSSRPPMSAQQVTVSSSETIILLYAH